jgi:hypothetical protein
LNPLRRTPERTELLEVYPSRYISAAGAQNLRADLSVDDLRARVKPIGGGDATEHESGHTVAASIDATPVFRFRLDHTSACATGS